MTLNYLNILTNVIEIPGIKAIKSSDIIKANKNTLMFFTISSILNPETAAATKRFAP